MANDLFLLKIVVPEGVSEVSVAAGTKFIDLAPEYQKNYKCRIVGAVFNNEFCDLTKEIPGDGRIEFFTMENRDGYLFYLRSIFFVMIKAAKEIFPHAVLHIEYSIGNGYYCWFEGLEWLEAGDVERISSRMKEIIGADMPFVRQNVTTEQAIEEFRKQDLPDKVSLFKIRTQPRTNIYWLGTTVGYFSGYLLPSTSYCDKFHLMHYKNGIVLVIPSQNNPDTVPAFQDSPKYFDIIQEHSEWLDVLELDTCAKLNDWIRRGYSKKIILLCEALHEKKLAKIADEIYRRRKMVRIVSIAGPSSSGKTTTANRLCIQLRVNGIKPFLISLDDYFIDRDKTPLDEKGEHDFESLAAIDIELFNKNLNDLMAGKAVTLPRYDFKTGKSCPDGKTIILPENGVLVIEGIHGLNPNLYADVPKYNIYKIYVSALTALNIDNHNRIPTTDGRLIRRMVRDFQYRGHSPIDTLKRWASVRSGEDKNIFPYQENADSMFNSTFVCEFSILKKYAEPLLRQVPTDIPEYREAKRLLKFLSFFEEIDDSTLPLNSILREFVGDSIFR
ncbi:nucleoside kinase [bacterium]|nr:nucleoside kinase [bacterium]